MQKKTPVRSSASCSTFSCRRVARKLRTTDCPCCSSFVFVHGEWKPTTGCLPLGTACNAHRHKVKHLAEMPAPVTSMHRCLYVMSKWRFDTAPRSNRSAAIPLSRMVDLATCVAKPECKIHHIAVFHVSLSQFVLLLASHEASACNLFERILASVSTKPHENWWCRDPQKNQDIPDQKTLRSSPSPRPDNMVATREGRNPNTLQEGQPLLGNKAKSERPSVIFFTINPSTLSWLPESREHRLHFETFELSRCLCTST